MCALGFAAAVVLVVIYGPGFAGDVDVDDDGSPRQIDTAGREQALWQWYLAEAEVHNVTHDYSTLGGGSAWGGPSWGGAGLFCLINGWVTHSIEAIASRP